MLRDVMIVLSDKQYFWMEEYVNKILATTKGSNERISPYRRNNEMVNNRFNIEKLKFCVLSLLVQIVAMLILGCEENDFQWKEVESDSKLGRKTQSLFLESENDPWPNGSIKVCFQPRKDVWENRRADYYTRIAIFQTWLEDAYETIPNVNIDFTGWGDCPNYLSFDEGDEGTDTIEIVVKIDGGAQASGRNLIRIALNAGKAWVLHETMHTLGFFAHEHQRIDSPGSVGTWSEYTNDPKFCGSDDIMYDNTPGTPTTCHPDNTRQDTPGIYLTVYDFWSISNATNYCHCRQDLSRLDMLGLEIVYPTLASLTNSPVHIEDGFKIGSGTVVGFDSVSLSNDWFYRGALPEAFDNGQVQWHSDSRISGTIDTGEGITITADETLWAVWNDYSGRQHISETLDVDINPTLATAILCSALSAI